MMEVFDDFIPESYLKDIQDHFLRGDAPWTYLPSVTYDKYKGDDLESFGFGMHICRQGNFVQSYSSTLLKGLLYSILDKTGKKTIWKSRIDMTLYNPNNYRHEVHTDLEIPNTTCIFYVNDSDGDTVLYEKGMGRSIEPKANRLLMFDGKIPHTGHSPSKHKNRVLVNTNCT